MPRTVDVFNVGLQISGDPNTAKSLQQSLAPAIEKFGTDFSKSVARVAKSLGDDLTEVTTKFNKGMASPDQIQRMEKAFYKGTEPIWKAIEKARDIEKKLYDETNLNQRKLYQEELKNLKKYAQTYQYALKDQFKKEVAKDEAVFERKKRLANDYADFLNKTVAEKLDDASESFSRGLSNVLQGNLREASKGLGSIFARMGAGIAERGTTKRMASEAAGGGGGMGAMMEMLGGFIGKAGAILSVVGGLAGGLAALVKVMIDADSQTKEFNKGLVETAGGLSMMGKSGLDAEDRLDELRKAAINSTAAINNLGNVSKVIKLGLTAKEYMEVTSKFEEMGVTFEKMRGNATNLAEATENYTQYVKAAADISRNFGMSLSEATEKISDTMLDLNQSLGEVKEGFAAIGAAAQESGYGTKRFFNMVLQATSGVTMYNVRLGATAKLLQNLVRVLGLKAGGDLLKDLGTKLQGESYQDRYKRILTTGSSVTGKVLGAEAGRQAEDITNLMKGRAFKTDGMTSGAAAALGAAAKGNVAALAKVTDKDRQSLLSALSHQDEALARRIDNLIDLSKGTKGDIGSQAKALEQLGPGGAIVMELNRAQAVLKKPLDEMKGVDLMAYQQMTGLSSEQIAQLQKVSRTVQGDFENAKEMAQKLKGDKSAELKYNEEIKKSGLKVEDGTVKSLDGQRKIQSANDALLEWSRNAHEEDLKSMSEQEKNSERIAENTYDLANLYSQSMIAILEDISDVVEEILVFLGLKEDKGPMKEEAKKQIAESETRQEELRKKETEIKDTVKALREEKKKGVSEERGKAIDAALQQAEKAQDAVKEEKKLLRDKSRAARGMITGGNAEAAEIYSKATAAGVSPTEAARLATGSNAGELLKKAEAARGAAALQAQSALPASTQTGPTLTLGGDVQYEAESDSEEDKARFMSDRVSQGMSDFWKSVTSPGSAALPGVSQTGGMSMTGEDMTEWAWGEEKKRWDKKDALDVKMKKTSDDQLVELKNLVTKVGEMTDENKQQSKMSSAISALQQAGAAPDTLSGLSAAMAAGDLKQFNVELAGIEGGEATASTFTKAGFKKGFRVQDALVMADGTVVQGSPGDAALLFDTAAMKNGGKGRVGGSANVVFNINATEGREDIVTDKVIAGLHQIYNVMTGDNVAIGA